MGATSVTGVSGPGSVDGIQKGSEHMSLGVNKLIGPRVVAAGTATLSGGGTATVSFPTLSGVAANYVGFAVDTAGAHAVGVTALTTSSMSLAGTATDVVNWMVVKVGF